jgi:hypothetical protein
VTTVGLYVQEQYTRNRLTLQGALRYDRAGSYNLDQQLGPDRFIPVPIQFPRSDGVSTFNDLNPRAGVAYNLFGNGKTALKANIGRYVEAASHNNRYFGTNPFNRIATNTTRSWTDGNRNYNPDCDLLNPAAQDFRASGGDFCGAYSASTFGTATFNNTYDPAILEGYRPADWGYAVSVQQEVLPRVSVEVGYFERWWSNFDVTDNRAVGPADYDPFSFTAPVDPRLPDGGGYPVTDLYDVKPAKFGLVDNYITASGNFGERTQRFRGVDVSVQARLGNGLTFQGGTSTGRTITDQCDVTPKVDSPSSRFCRVEPPFLTQFKGLGSYIVPKIDVRVSGTYQSLPGPHIAANYVAGNAEVIPNLGRPLAGVANITFNMAEPGSVYGERLHQLDLRFAKLVRFSGRTVAFNVDLYNALNANPVVLLNNNYAAWQVPQGILQARFVKLSAQLDF